MRNRWFALAVVAASLGATSCVSDALKAGRDTVTWTGEKVWDGSKWVVNETRYAFGADRPRQVNLNNEVFSSSRYSDAYTAELSAETFMGYAFDLAKTRKKSATLTELDVEWLLWSLDGEKKDLFISEEDAREAFTAMVNMAGASIPNPLAGSTDKASGRGAPPTPEWIKP